MSLRPPVPGYVIFLAAVGLLTLGILYLGYLMGQL
jgi:hypothetical protein